MHMSARDIGRLLVTGVPGWLSGAFLHSLRETPLPGLRVVRCLVQPGQSLPREQEGDATPFEVEYVVGDLSDSASLGIAVRNVDSVLHTASLIHVRRTRDWYEINTKGTDRLVREAVEAGVDRFVLISSNAAAGRSPSPDRLLTETDVPLPLSHYGRSKLLAEQAVHAQQHRLESVVLRPCMFYGPPVPERHVEVYLRVQAGRMPLVGDGEFARSLSYIDHVVQGCRLALAHPAANGQTYFISDRPVYTTKRVVEAMASALGVPARFIRVPRLAGPLAYGVDMALARIGLYWQSVHLAGESDWHVGVSCEKACRELGYTPTVELEEGMKAAVEWCRATGRLPSTSDR